MNKLAKSRGYVNDQSIRMSNNCQPIHEFFSQHGQEKQLMYNVVDTSCVAGMWEDYNFPYLKWLFSLRVIALEMYLNIKPLIYLLVRKLI